VEKGSRDQGLTRLRPTNLLRNPNKLAEEEVPEEEESKAQMGSYAEMQKLVKGVVIKIEDNKREMSLLEVTEEAEERVEARDQEDLKPLSSLTDLQK
jgi:hypothetical protein